MLNSQTSASGHKRPFTTIIPERLLPGVKQPFPVSGIDGTLSLDCKSLLFSKADAQIIQNCRN